MALFDSPGITATVLIAGAAALRFLSVSPQLLLIIGLVTLFLLAGSQPSGGAEQFSPVYTSGVASGLQYGVAAVQGRRPYMEDMHQIADFDDEPAAKGVNMTHFFAVYDGHGGKRAAAWAHAHLVQNLLQELKPSSSEPSPNGTLDAAAVDAFHKTDGTFLKQAALRGIPDGSTAVTCMIQQGDLAVSRAFGDAHLKPYGVSSTPELSALSLSSRDAYLVLASDGLWDVVDEQQCASSVLRAADPLGAARALCDLASTRGSMDNITVLVVALWP